MAEQVDVPVADTLPRGGKLLGRLLAKLLCVGEPDHDIVVESLVT
jgi:hypothetical protein